ncbi:MAG: hypothetical protein IPF92_22685 [Myxococcales bacterium]|jgi:hypothetical protein|nr:hypothetical protein [Myxococcales bacterium]
MTGEKKQLGKVLLKRQVLGEAELASALSEEGSEPLASKLIARGLVKEADVLRGLSEQFGVPAVDLERVGIDTSHLVVPADFAKQHKVLPLFADDERVLVAMLAPDDLVVLTRLASLTGRSPTPYVALPLPLHRAIEGAYAAARSGGLTYFGRHARTAESPAALLSLATFVPPERRTDDALVFTDDSLREVSNEEPLSERLGDDIRPSTLALDHERMLEGAAAAFLESRAEDAIALLRDAIHERPKSFRARYQLGLVLGNVDRLHEAITEVEHALELEPSSFPALKNLAVLYEKSGFRARALETWERAAPLAPDEATRARVTEHLTRLR